MDVFGICQICGQKVLQIDKEHFSQEDIDLYEGSSNCTIDLGSIKLKYEATPNVYENVIPE